MARLATQYTQVKEVFDGDEVQAFFDISIDRKYQCLLELQALEDGGAEATIQMAKKFVLWFDEFADHVEGYVFPGAKAIIPKDWKSYIPQEDKLVLMRKAFFGGGYEDFLAGFGISASELRQNPDEWKAIIQQAKELYSAKYANTDGSGAGKTRASTRARKKKG